MDRKSEQFQKFVESLKGVASPNMLHAAFASVAQLEQVNLSNKPFMPIIL
jgi:hypothetical protein